MVMEDSGLEGYENTFDAIDPVMKKLGFYPSWDYHKIAYDYKLEERGHAPDYYIRIPCKVTGTVEMPDCELEFRAPVLFKHYYPHGINYDAEIPQNLQKKAAALVEKVKERLAELPLPEKY